MARRIAPCFKYAESTAQPKVRGSILGDGSGWGRIRRDGTAGHDLDGCLIKEICDLLRGRQHNWRPGQGRYHRTAKANETGLRLGVMGVVLVVIALMTSISFVKRGIARLGAKSKGDTDHSAEESECNRQYGKPPEKRPHAQEPMSTAVVDQALMITGSSAAFQNDADEVLWLVSDIGTALVTLPCSKRGDADRVSVIPATNSRLKDRLGQLIRRSTSLPSIVRANITGSCDDRSGSSRRVSVTSDDIVPVNRYVSSHCRLRTYVNGRLKQAYVHVGGKV